MKTNLRLKGKLRPQKPRLAICYEQSALAYRLPAKCPAFGNAYYLVPFLLLILVFVSFGAVLAQETVGHTAPAAKAEIISGIVVSAETGEPLEGATIKIKNTNNTTTTNVKGEFVLNEAKGNDILQISFVGYEKQEIVVKNRQGAIYISLQKGESNILDETVIMGYGTTTRRLNTGSIGRVTYKEIGNQPVSNPLATLSGRIPGVIIVQSSGISGSGFNIEIRGQNSLRQGSQPLFVVDGVPFLENNRGMNQLNSAAGSSTSNGGGLSPLNLINTHDIENIEVLKDADATAIYGSRGANGVVLISTKTGKVGETVFSANFYNGLSKVTRSMKMLSRQDYIEMRKEGIRNDGLVPTISNAPDIVLWDTTRYTNFKDFLIGGNAATQDAQLSVSAGNEQIQFALRGGFRKETSVFPTDLGEKKATIHSNINHRSKNNRFKLSMVGFFSSTSNQLTVSDLTSGISTTPILKLYDEDGKLNWDEGGVTYSSLGFPNLNPLKFEFEEYDGQFQNINGNVKLNYQVFKPLDFVLNLGYNSIKGNEVSTYQRASLNPHRNQLPRSSFANRNQNSWIVEPQMEFSPQTGQSKLKILLGSTWQASQANGSIINATNYTNDLLLKSIAGAGNVNASNNFNEYRYQGIYGRFNYILREKYILNLSGRRDGSSRFGINNRYANFGAIGGAWLFSEEGSLKEQLGWFSFGKIRMSYGTTGNDQISDYGYLDTWSTVNNGAYQGLPTLRPTSLANPDFAWEINRKLEGAIELGFLNDRILLSSAYYRNISSNQLVSYALPIQTGFSSVIANIDAKILNRGLEFQLNSVNLSLRKFRWETSFNLSKTSNRLMDFYDLMNSSYANTYIIGQPLSALKLYRYLGVNTETGIYEVEDVNQDGLYGLADRVEIINTNPKFYGGLQNSFSYKNLQLDVFFEFRKQMGKNYLYSLSSGVPGYDINNHPEIVMNRWQKPGDITDIQRFTSQSSEVLAAASRMRLSNGVFSDASFIRCKNINASYGFKQEALKPLGVKALRIYLQAQNVFTITNYLGADPENQNQFILPPLKTFAAGIELNF